MPAGTEWKRAALDADLGYISAETLSAETAVLDAEMGSIELGRLKADTAETSGEMGNVETVSYTHLDVYKRQEFMRYRESLPYYRNIEEEGRKIG